MFNFWTTNKHLQPANIYTVGFVKKAQDLQLRSLKLRSQFEGNWAWEVRVYVCPSYVHVKVCCGDLTLQQTTIIALDLLFRSQLSQEHGFDGLINLCTRTSRSPCHNEPLTCNLLRQIDICIFVNLIQTPFIGPHMGNIILYDERMVACLHQNTSKGPLNFLRLCLANQILGFGPSWVCILGEGPHRSLWMKS